MQTLLSHYRVIEEIGTGAMGVVYRAHDERLQRDVALKVLPAGAFADASGRKRFRKEALALSKLNHPNIATIFDFDSDSGTEFLVEELISGLPLDEALIAGPLSEREIVILGTQMCEGLAAAHDQGVIHCDLKPANMRLTSDSHIKILDFGLAQVRRTPVAGGDVNATASTVLERDTMGGTLPYMSPEQLLNGKVDARVDIWAAGCVLFEMATGRRPFLGSGAALIDAILHQPAPAATNINTRITPALDTIIGKCLDKEPAKRYSSAREIAVDLRRLGSPSASFWTRARLLLRRYRVVASGVLLLTTAIYAFRTPLLSTRWPFHRTPPSAGQAVHDLYLRGMENLKRWDKAGNVDAALSQFQQATKADPNFALGFSALCEAYWTKYRLDHNSQWIGEAETSCRRAAELNSNLPAVYVTLSRLHNGKAEYNLALQEIQEAIQLEPRDPDALLGQAAVYSSMGRAAEAEEIYKKAAALRPEDWDTFYELGVSYYLQRRLADAAAQFERVLEITPDNALAHATLGAVLQLMKRETEAEQHLKRALELQPSYAAYTNLGALYYRQKRWSESAAMTRKALEINDTDWRAWANVALAYEWLERRSDAEYAYRQELERIERISKISVDDTEVQAELGMLYARQKLRKKAIAHIEAALVRAPEDPTILANAAECYEYLGERSMALDFIKKALARGYTLAQLENNPGQKQLVTDPRFETIARQFRNKASPVQQQP